MPPPYTTPLPGESIRLNPRSRPLCLATITSAIPNGTAGQMFHSSRQSAVLKHTRGKPIHLPIQCHIDKWIRTPQPVQQLRLPSIHTRAAKLAHTNVGTVRCPTTTRVSAIALTRCSPMWHLGRGQRAGDCAVLAILCRPKNGGLLVLL